MPMFRDQRHLDQLSALTNAFPRQSFPEKRVLIEPHQKMPRFGFLHHGVIKGYLREHRQGKAQETLFDVFGGPEWFGIEHLLYDQSQAFYRTMTPCEVSFLPREWFYQEAPYELVRDITLCTVFRREFFIGQTYAASMKLKFKVLRCLLKVGARVDGDLPFSQKDLATLTGASRDATNRVLKGLEKEGLIECRHKKIHIKDWETLRQANYQALGERGR